MSINPHTNAIIGRECRFVKHLPALPGVREDIHYIKEQLHHEDGRVTPNIKIIKDYKRPYYVTKEHFRNHKDKKEEEYLNRLSKGYTTETYLPNTVAATLGMVGYKKNSMRDILRSPYVYGTDVKSTVLIKEYYKQKFANFSSKYSVCALDIESDVRTKEILMITVSMYDKIVTVVNNKIFNDNYTTEERNEKLQSMYKKYIPTKTKPDSDGKIKDVKITKMIGDNVNFIFHDDEIDVIKTTFEKVHEWAPDFLSIWNMNFDIPFIIERIKQAGLLPQSIFCDPDLPENYKVFKYKEGQKQRIREDGTVISIDFSEQWHTLDCTASFYVMDAMCSYRQVRQGRPMIPGGYSLDNVLDKELGLNKLKFDDINANYKGAEWHMFMVKHHPYEYIIYNQWDVMGMLELELKNGDLAFSIPMLVGSSEFVDTTSGPRQIVNELYFYLQEKGKMIGNKNAVKDKNKLLGLDKWIAVLPAYRIIDNGLKIIKDLPHLSTNIRGFVYDIDAVSSYPSNTQCVNLSKRTTKREIVSIEGMEKDDFKLQNINLISGPVNALDYCHTMYSFPKLTELRKEMLKYNITPENVDEPIVA